MVGPTEELHLITFCERFVNTRPTCVLKSNLIAEFQI